MARFYWLIIIALFFFIYVSFSFGYYQIKSWPLMNDTRLISATVTIICVIIIYCIERPLNIVRPLEREGESKRFLVNITRQLRSAGERLPPAFPNGWFSLVESRFLKPGRVIGVNALGNRFAVFRSTTPECIAYVLDAYCPHMGADMTIGGGVVNGDCLRCPFHAWTFRGEDGKCLDIPYASEVPNFAKVKRWPSVERNGHIYIWYHCQDIEPSWPVPEIEEITKGEWTYRGRSEHYVKSHIQDIPENGADVAHLNFLHRPSIFFGSNLENIDLSAKSGILGEHTWAAEWKALSAPDQHIGVMRLRHRMKIFGFHLPFTDLNVEARQIGPAMVQLRFDAGIFGKGAYVQHVTPLEPFLQKLTHHVYAERKMPTLIAKFLLWGEVQQVERDIMIWDKKKYVRNPMLVKEDSLIKRHRRWYEQFYSESSADLMTVFMNNNHKKLDF